MAYLTSNLTSGVRKTLSNTAQERLLAPNEKLSDLSDHFRANNFQRIKKNGIKQHSYSYLYGSNHISPRNRHNVIKRVFEIFHKLIAFQPSRPILGIAQIFESILARFIFLISGWG